MTKTNKEGHTLQYCIEHSKDIWNGKRVYQILMEAGIDDWDTLVNMWSNGYLPIRNLKGIGDNTWTELVTMARKEEYYRNPLGRTALIDEITGICFSEGREVHNSYNKIINGLRRAHIFTLEQLWGAPWDYICGIRGFGPRFLSVLEKIRQDETGSHQKHYEAFIKEYDYHEYFKSGLVDAWKKKETGDGLQK